MARRNRHLGSALVICLAGGAGCLLTTDTTVTYPTVSEDSGGTDTGGNTDTGGTTDASVRDTRPQDAGSDSGGTDTGGNTDTGGTTDASVRDTRPQDAGSDDVCDDFCDNYELLNECAARPSRPCPIEVCERVSEDCRDCIAEAECGEAHFCEDACGRLYCSAFFPEECGEFDAGFPDAENPDA